MFLDAPNEGGARAGELCARHVRALVPPRGWNVVDLRDAPPPTAAASTAQPLELAPGTTVYVATPPPPTPWHPRFERGDTLGGVLEADTPLLSRAFGNVSAQ